MSLAVNSMGSDIIVSSALAFVGDVLTIAGCRGFVLSLRLPVADVDAGMGVSGIFENAVTLFSYMSSQNWSISSCGRFNSRIWSSAICGFSSPRWFVYLSVPGRPTHGGGYTIHLLLSILQIHM